MEDQGTSLNGNSLQHDFPSGKKTMANKSAGHGNNSPEQAPYLSDLLFLCQCMMSYSDEFDDHGNPVYQKHYQRPFDSYQGLMSSKGRGLSSTYLLFVFPRYILH